MQVQSCHHCLFGLRKCHTVPHSVLLTGKITGSATPPTNLNPADRTTVSQKHLSPILTLTFTITGQWTFLPGDLGFAGLALTRFTVKGQISYSDFPQIQYLSSHKLCLMSLCLAWIKANKCFRIYSVIVVARRWLLLYSNYFLLFIHHNPAQMGEYGMLETNFSDTIALVRLASLIMHYDTMFIYQYCNFAYEMIPSLVYSSKISSILYNYTKRLHLGFHCWEKSMMEAHWRLLMPLNCVTKQTI